MGIARFKALFPIAIVLVAFCWAVPVSAAPTPATTPHPKPPGPLGIARLATGTRLPNRGNWKVSAAACDRRTVAVNPPSNQLGPRGASESQTLVAVPLNGDVAAATRESEIAEICAHLRR